MPWTDFFRNPHIRQPLLVGATMVILATYAGIRGYEAASIAVVNMGLLRLYQIYEEE